MALNFPSSPALNDTYTSGSRTWQWDGTSWGSVGDINAAQTLTNKTLSVDNNTVSGIAASSFVLSNGSGNIDGAAAQKVIPIGVVVGTTDIQTLTNKTLVTPTLDPSPSGTTFGRIGFDISGDMSYGDGSERIVVDTTKAQTLTNKTLTSPTITSAVLNNGYTEGVFAVTGTTPALSPTNGSIQTWTLTANSTPTQGTWVAGQSITLMVNDTASAFTVNWTSLPVTWVGGTAPTLAPGGGFTVIVLWEVGTTIYGALTGQVA